MSLWRTGRQMWFIHTVEYYAAPKREEILTHAATWTSPEGVMPSEISQSQRTNAVIPLTRDLRGHVEIEGRWWVPGGGEGEGRGWGAGDSQGQSFGPARGGDSGDRWHNKVEVLGTTAPCTLMAKAGKFLLSPYFIT